MNLIKYISIIPIKNMINVNAEFFWSFIFLISGIRSDDAMYMKPPAANGNKNCVNCSTNDEV